MMILLLVFLLAAQDSTGVAMPGNAQVETGLALGRLPGGSLDFVIIDFTPVTQLGNLSPNLTHRIRADHKEIPSAASDISKHNLLHTASSQLRRMIALKCLGGAAQRLPSDENEFQASANLECSFLDTFMVVSGLPQGAHLTSAKASELKAQKVGRVGIQAQESTQSRQLKSSGLILDETTALVTLPADLLSHHHPSGLMIGTQQPDWSRYKAAAEFQVTRHVLDEAQMPSRLIAQKAPKRIQPQGGMGLGSAQTQGLRVQKPTWYRLHLEGSWGKANRLYHFCSHEPYVRQLPSILKKQKAGVSSLNLDDYEAHNTRRRLLRILLRPCCAIFSFCLVIVFVWAMGKCFEMMGNWPELQPFENEEVRAFRRGGEAVLRHFCHNAFRY